MAIKVQQRSMTENVHMNCNKTTIDTKKLEVKRLIMTVLFHETTKRELSRKQPHCMQERVATETAALYAGASCHGNNH